ncbi:MAG: hypothetical protein WKF60_03410, partial [Ilumatobacter sp.]
DDLLDAIEAGDVATLGADAEAPDGALHDLFRAADNLARDATHTSGRQTLLDLVPRLSAAAPPFGIAVNAWSAIVGRAETVVEQFELGADPEHVTEAADDLRSVCRPYV